MMAFARQVLDALPIAVCTVDPDGTITGANRSWSQFAEAGGAPPLAPEFEVRGQSLLAAIADPDYREQVRQAMELLRTGRSARVRWEALFGPPREERVFLLQIAPLRDQLQVTGFVFSAADITSSHRSRESLLDSGLALARAIDLDALFHEVAQQARRVARGDALAVLLASGGPSLQLAYAAGYEQETATLEAALLPSARAAMAGGRVVATRVEQGIALAAPMGGEGRTMGVMTLLIDSGRSHQEVEEAQRLLAILAAQAAVAVERVGRVGRAGDKRRLEGVGEVATGVAHELRNPLFGISSAAQLLRFRARDDPVVEKNVGRILREVERLNHVVASLLEFGHPKPTALAPGNPDAIWDAVWEGQRGLLESRALVLQRSRPPSPVICRIDRDQIAQLFLNLLVNAVDHAPEGSDLTLHSFALPNGGWRLELTNGGPAIPSDVLPHVFELFYSTKPGGTGVGLALCQRIIDEHHGEIGIESAPDTGTTVTVALPPAGA